MSDKKKLYRSSEDRWIAGVLGGISAYFDWNSTLVRILYIILMFTPGVGLVAILAYIVMIAIIPAENAPVSFFNQLKSTYKNQNSSKKSRKVIHGVEEEDINHDKKRG
ncbi:PspC domain-containing protein [Lentilactobacillus hilgardii]|uniref:PspC domain protein n=1 Tax=Lentilactobacillus hilgardii (strain ATCC 8290 / DSM 20176 / CCUG 30140 / JCM 1155 / KCTC 3500 / NBRC 15886 / NCIMB 8040 / NRRL B-1843 / 9) TaxID=1423757 RepID=C0XMQ9_LENH9|nr:PspC domain-containing protein [Lentilactobacillus hilgardii]EEI23338.1 PspC domain protein [Lentilactobacillus hilgardii DSM 20176 = ATCC 8290]KRK54392.1 stress-responsive transcriptional regulator [Lentilactobacillus hilgardii DSM 20176 = ATCC 8290]MCP9333363.1 PspC domain-containing protein [Lentilactobacillus hilgardii]MCP9349965.1 PspC domain-containing protein [Lentilactobacillus hilgardii]MCP9352900.1 PspC domain-containing protein [Lentilactobacillus hilgardii]